jgi:hypothetical protein
LAFATRPPDDPQWVEWESGVTWVQATTVADAISAASGIKNDPD